MTIDKYSDRINDCIQYADGGKQPYKADNIINNTYNIVLYMGLYKEPIKMWCKNLSPEKTWADFKKFFAEENHDLR